MTSPEEGLKILFAETKRLEQYLSSLPPEAWQRPSACDRWTVADVVAHLCRNNRNFTARIVRSLKGDTSPDELTPSAVGAGLGDPEGSAQGVIDYRKELGDQLLSEFIKGNQALKEVLANLVADDWDRLFYRRAFPEPIRNVVPIFIAEIALHGWDIRSRLDPEAGLPADCIPIIVERIPERPRWWTFRLEAGFSPLPIRCRFQISTPPQYQIDTVVAEDRQFMEVGSKAPAPVTFHSDGETFVMVMYGRVKLDEAVANGRISTHGDQRLAGEFIQRFTGG